MSRKPRAQFTKQTAWPTQVTLAAVLQVRDGVLQALLWQRALDPFAGAWALPGGVLSPEETLEASIRRHLAAKVDLAEVAHLEQVATYGDPGRNPVEWEIATAYLGLVPLGIDPSVPDDTSWHPVDALPATAFDHGGDRPFGARPAARQALLLEHRLRTCACDLHPQRAARRLHRCPRLRRLGDEPEARPDPARSAAADRGSPSLGQGRWAPRRGVRLRRAGARDRRPVRRPPPARPARVGKRRDGRASIARAIRQSATSPAFGARRTSRKADHDTQSAIASP